MALKKGIVFTIDALIALSVFLTSTFVLYSYFSEDPTAALAGTGLYTKNENLIRMVDKAELFSSTVNLYQKGDVAGTTALMALILNSSEFPSNLYVYIWNGTALNQILSDAKYTFTQKVVVRKILVMTITQNTQKISTNVSVSANSSLAGKNITVPVSVYNPTGAPLAGLTATISARDMSDAAMPWPIIPPTQSVPLVSPGGTQTVNFLVVIPDNAFLDEYFIAANVTGPGYSQSAIDPFNVFRLGLVEMVSGEVK
jgi:hypothetical protein